MNRHVFAATHLFAATLGAVTALAGRAAGQDAVASPELHAAIASAEHRRDVPAIRWLCDELLPSLPQWPQGLDPQGAFSLSLSAEGLQIRATDVAIPSGAVAFGTCSFSAAQPAPQIVWRCEPGGREQWFVPDGFALPDQWRQLLHALEVDLVGHSRTLSVSVITGHLAGGMIDTDPRAALLRLGPALCGEATWHTHREPGQLVVNGRSDGGLMLPLTLLALCIAEGSGELSALSLRAFAARDADQSEAARQLGRSDRELDARTLRALLHAEDEVRLAAIEALVRHGACNELPAIVHAADVDHPWASIAARDAVTRLWPIATTEQRDATEAALRSSNSERLRHLDLTTLPTAAPGTSTRPISPVPQPGPATASARERALILLFCSAIGLLGLWRRERMRVAMLAN